MMCLIGEGKVTTDVAPILYKKESGSEQSQLDNQFPTFIFYVLMFETVACHGILSPD